jgi:hypothetical protein
MASFEFLVCEKLNFVVCIYKDNATREQRHPIGLNDFAGMQLIF